jgi:hypothetical protein
MSLLRVKSFSPSQDFDELKEILSNFQEALLCGENDIAELTDKMQVQESKRAQLDHKYNQLCSKKGRLEAEVETQRNMIRARDKEETAICKTHNFHQLAKELPLDENKRGQFNRQMKELEESRCKELGKLKEKQQQAEDNLTTQCSEQSAEINMRAKQLNELKSDQSTANAELRKVMTEVRTVNRLSINRRRYVLLIDCAINRRRYVLSIDCAINRWMYVAHIFASNTQTIPPPESFSSFPCSFHYSFLVAFSSTFFLAPSLCSLLPHFVCPIHAYIVYIYDCEDKFAIAKFACYA